MHFYRLQWSIYFISPNQVRGRKRGPKKPLNDTSSNRTLTIFNLFDKDPISVHDLIDFVGTIGANVVSSNKPLQPPQLFAKRRALTSVCNLSQKRKRATSSGPVEAVVDNYIKTSIQSSQAVFDRLRTHAHKIIKGRGADFTPKNPFLYPWEHDKDRMNGGQWRERRDQFLVFLSLFFKFSEQYSPYYGILIDPLI